MGNGICQTSVHQSIEGYECYEQCVQQLNSQSKSPSKPCIESSLHIACKSDDDGQVNISIEEDCYERERRFSQIQQQNISQNRQMSKEDINQFLRLLKSDKTLTRNSAESPIRVVSASQRNNKPSLIVEHTNIINRSSTTLISPKSILMSSEKSMSPKKKVTFGLVYRQV